MRRFTGDSGLTGSQADFAGEIVFHNGTENRFE